MIYFNFIRCVVYKFTASLPQIRYKGRITFKSVNLLYYSVKSPVPVKEELLFKSGIKVASAPPLTFPFGNINNYKYIYTQLIFYNSSVAGDKKTPYNSIFLAVNPFDKARYKFHRRGLV